MLWFLLSVIAKLKLKQNTALDLDTRQSSDISQSALGCHHKRKNYVSTTESIPPRPLATKKLVHCEGREKPRNI